MSQPQTPRSPAATLERIAAQVMAADPSDVMAIRNLQLLLEDLAVQAMEADPAGIRADVESCIAALDRGLGGDAAALGAVLDQVSEATARMQDAVARTSLQPVAPRAPAAAPARASAAPAGGRALLLPEWGDLKTLQEFIGGQRTALEEIEASILAMEKGDASERAAFKRKLHTLKGEAGVLGLTDMEKVAHALEDLVEKAPASPELVDRLLKVRDWMTRTIDAYARMQLPEQDGPSAIAAWIAPPLSAVAAPVPAPTATATSTPTETAAPAEEGERVERDAETVGLFGEFLSESADGIGRVDEILMNVEQDGATPDSVNSLFRVFHTIKGTAGFLELEHVVELAHTTETMLNKCREGALALEGAVIDVVFDATAAMRTMLDGIRTAIEKSTPFPHPADASALLRRIEAATEGVPLAEKPLPAVAPGEKLGEVLQRSPAHVPAPVIEKALERQPETGRRLGEELVADGAAKAEDVAHALRAQARVEKEPAKEVAEGQVKLKETIKVDLERVDSLVEMIGELVVVESMVVNAPEIGRTGAVRVRNMLAQLAKVTRDLQDVGMRMRMVPVAGVFQKMARMVRDLSRKSGKQVRLVTSGESTEMDRSMVEQIADPLVHMIRNSMDHGVEGPEERVKRGKPETGVIKLSAYHEGGSVVIEIADDGRGLDRERIVQKAIDKGLITSTEGMAEADIDALIFAPGFSTAAQVTEISGRGVGMDVVKRNIEGMRGRVLISTTKGQGTRFKMVLPLTLAIIDGMLVASGKERYIVPTLSIVESIQPDRSMLVTLASQNEMINLRGEILPLARLDRLFRLQGAKSDPTEALVVVVEGVGKRFGVLVDEVVAQQQVVIKSMGSGLSRTPFVSGAAILSDGKVGLILNVEEISTHVHKGSRAVAQEAWVRAGSPASAEMGLQA
ncbi:MAG: chemotaxis protein CheW [Deltaproteobacteria bacterium]|nr:chemotaxis protein CheW [Deltaproteobacteria bacterium]